MSNETFAMCLYFGIMALLTYFISRGIIHQIEIRKQKGDRIK